MEMTMMMTSAATALWQRLHGEGDRVRLLILLLLE
jgi:hypothetical protein